MNYEQFLKSKAIPDNSCGFKPVWMPKFLFDFQRMLVDWSVARGRAAVYADCGLGKTPMQLVWAQNVVQQTNGKVLILCPLSVSPQTIKEGEKFDIKVHRSWKGESKKGINITNYERLKHFNPKDFAGVVLDESGILKNFDGKYRKEITDFLSRVKHRSLWSATPAPNDWMELGTQSEALGEMGRNQMLGMFFTNGGETTQEWELKGHARRRFWRWVSTWARTIRKPSDFGFPDEGFILPPLHVQRHLVPAAMKKKGFRAEARTLEQQREEKWKTLVPRCEKVLELLPKGKSFIAWCHLNDEGDLLEKILPGAVQVSGSDRDEEKEEKLVAFASGQVKVLVTKPKIASHGLNWQHCSDMSVFASHSHEAYYQLVRRCWRFGQKNPVTVNMVASEAELPVLKNMVRKERLATDMFEGVIREMHEFQTGKVQEDNHKVDLEVPAWFKS